MEWLTQSGDNANAELAALPVAQPAQSSFVDRAKAFTSSLLQNSAANPLAGASPYDRVVDMIPSLERSGDFAVNPKSKASGRYQITPDTAAFVGADYGKLSDPTYARGVAAKIVPRYAQLIGSSEPDDLLAAYNWGPGHVKKWIAAGRPDAMLPAETRNYIARAHRQTNFSAARTFAQSLPGPLGLAGGGALSAFEGTPAAVDEISTPGFLHSLANNFGAGFREGEIVDNTNADEHALADAYGDLTAQVNRLSPADKQLANPLLYNALRPRGFAAGFSHAENPFGLRLWQRVAQLKQENPGAAANLPGSEAELQAQVRDRQRQALFGTQEETARSGPLAANLGQFTGKALAGFEDPVNLLAMGMGAPAASTLVRTFVIEGALNAGADAVGLPSRLARTEKLGAPPPSAAEIGEELGADFLLGGALPTGIKSLGHLVHAFDTRFPDAGDNARSTRNATADLARRQADNPHTDDDAGRETYRRDLAATSAVLDGGAPLPAPSPLGPGARALAPDFQRGDGHLLQQFKTADLATDAAQMQYKSGGDAQGVTDRLQGVDSWDPVSAGLLTIWERNDGTAIVANGHQRLALAKRLEAGGHPPIALNGYVFHEADGWSARDMRVTAALTNIREGSGEGIDAARILREAPDKDFGLPPRSPLVRQARDLAKLKGTAWDMAVNGAVEQRDAAIVGRLAPPDESMQTALLAYLAKAAPATAEEAELTVRQALAAGARTETQTDMFGTLLKSDLVLPARIAILKNAMTQLRRDRALFNTLVSKEGAIAEAGNVLKPEENARRRLQADTVFATLKALAERKGPVSDALQQAAEQSLKSGDRRAATRQFLADVRSRVGEGLDRLGADGDTLRAGDAAAEDAAAPEGETGDGTGRERSAGERATQLDAFSDPQKREAFDQQTKALAREIVPTRETKAEAPKGDITQTVKSEFGGAAPEIEALRALPDGMIAPDQEQYGLFSADSQGITLKEVRSEIEREARAVERLRGCVEGGG